MEYVHRESNIKRDSTRLRIIVGVAIPLAGLFFAYFLWSYNPAQSLLKLFYLFCPLYALTDLYCPFCGITRAANELLHFNIIAGIKDNALVVLLIGPVSAYFLFREYVNYIFDRELLPAPIFKKWMFVTIIAITILFAILRNIPLAPFNFLAPLALS